MPTLNELRQLRAAKVTEAKLAAEDGPKFDAIEADIKALDGKIDEAVAAEKAAAERRSKLASWEAELAKPQGRQSQPSTPGDTSFVGQTHSISATSRPNGETDNKPFRHIGEQLCAVAAIEFGREQGRDTTELRNRLNAAHQLAVDGWTLGDWTKGAEALGTPAGASAGMPTDGGVLIQPDFVNDLTSRMFQGGQILGKCRRFGCSANSNGLVMNLLAETSRATGSRWGGVQVYWGNEADTATAKKPAFRRTELQLGKLLGLMYATEELLSDASLMQGVAQQAFSEEFTFTVEDAIVRGDGTGKPQGLLSAPATVSVSKETGQAAATITFENIQKMWARMHAAHRGNAVWYIHQDCEPQLNSMAMNIGTGGVPVYLPPGGLTATPFATLMGRPVVPVEYCSALGTVGDIILADFSQYLVIDKGGVNAASSAHVKFLTDEMTFRFTYRVNGMPLWHSALTQYKGSNTLSPYITLATRA